MLINDILWCLLPFTIGINAQVISLKIERSTWADLSAPTVTSDLPSSALAARDINAINLQTTASSSPCGSDPCKSSTTSSASCTSSDPCAKSDTTETEIHLATITLQTTEMQTAYITDHITTTQHTVRMFTKTVNIAETVTSTTTVPGCSTFTTTVTTWSTTTTTNIHPAPPPTSGCGSASCTVTTTVATDVDVPTSTTAAGAAKISGHDVVEVMTEQKMQELMAKKKKQEMAEKKEKDIADKGHRNAARLVARESMGFDGKSSAAGKLTKEASVEVDTPPTFGTTLITLTRGTPLETGTAEIETITQSPSYSAGKARSENSEAGMVDPAVSATLTARSTLACITIRSQGAHSTICPDTPCWTYDC